MVLSLSGGMLGFLFSLALLPMGLILALFVFLFIGFRPFISFCAYGLIIRVLYQSVANVLENVNHLLRVGCAGLCATYSVVARDEEVDPLVLEDEEGLSGHFGLAVCGYHVGPLGVHVYNIRIVYTYVNRDSDIFSCGWDLLVGLSEQEVPVRFDSNIGLFSLQ